MRIALLLAVAIALILAACSADDNLPSSTISPTPTLAGDGLIVCPQVGGASSSVTPPPTPSCGAGSNVEIAPGLRGHITLSPQYPQGAQPITEYMELSGTTGIGATIALPIHWPAPTGTTARWYTNANHQWNRLQPANVGDNQRGTLVSASFNLLPDNLIVLAEPTS